MSAVGSLDSPQALKIFGTKVPTYSVCVRRPARARVGASRRVVPCGFAPAARHTLAQAVLSGALRATVRHQAAHYITGRATRLDVSIGAESNNARHKTARYIATLAALLGILVGAGCTTQDRSSADSPLSAHRAASGFPVTVGESFRDRPVSPELVVIPPGSFTMGSAETETTREGRRAETAAWERPQHPVTVTTALGVGKYPVTRKEFAAFVAATHRPMNLGCTVLDGTWQQEDARSFADPAFAQSDLDPALCVGVDDAEAYAQWLSATTGHRYRLLREAEWEYAARAGTTTSRWWGDARDTLCAHANGADRSFVAAYPAELHANTTCDDGFVHTNPGNAFPANPFGLYDMLGNVWEWTADCFTSDYQAAPSNASTEITSGDCSRRVIRGGSWHNSPDSLRSAARFWLPPAMHSSSLGFRIVRLPDTGPSHGVPPT